MKRLVAPLVLAGALLVAAAPAQARFVHFTSPSGNIDCLGSTTGPVFVQCLVQRASWPNPPRRPANCDLDFSPTEAQLANRRVTMGACRGDVGPQCFQEGSGIERCTVLPYGRSVAIGGIRCTSATIGVTCRYTRAKLGKRPGFRVSRQGYAILR
jgi:hypothetical protein